MVNYFIFFLFLRARLWSVKYSQMNSAKCPTLQSLIRPDIKFCLYLVFMWFRLGFPHYNVCSKNVNSKHPSLAVSYSFQKPLPSWTIPNTSSLVFICVHYKNIKKCFLPFFTVSIFQMTPIALSLLQRQDKFGQQSAPYCE